jgi:ketopantoate reductase
MNERIKKLAEQADEYADNKIQMPGEYHPDWHDTRDEKFAELIVTNAIGVLQKRFMGDLNREDMEVRRCIEDLKKHFGVEE